MTTFIEPHSVTSQNGLLYTSVHLTTAIHTVEVEGTAAFSLTTRTFNGTLPGPTLRVKPGDTVFLEYHNDLPEGGKPYEYNQISAPNESNLYFHGLRVAPGEEDVILAPGESHRYTLQIPSDHLPGTHFFYPRRHGSSALQVGGGAAAAIIVEDDPEHSRLPPEILNTPEVLLLLQEMDLNQLQQIAKASQDNLLQVEIGDRSILDATQHTFYLTNGQINPQIAIRPNIWYRLRLVHSGWLPGILELELPGCELQLIAKDGIYLPILPRKIEQSILLVNGARADVMVLCPFRNGDTEYSMFSAQRGQSVVKFVREDSPLLVYPPVPVPITQMEFPSYLEDLQSTPASPGCACDVETSQLEYDENVFLYQSYQGAVVERRLVSKWHPYHQQANPFQLVSREENDEYYQPGDWHDVIDGTHVVRYRPNDYFIGKMVMGCQILIHQDEGMMAMEYIHPGNQSSSCVCGQPTSRLPLFEMVLIFCGGFVAFLLLTVWCSRNRGTSTKGFLNRRETYHTDAERPEEHVAKNESIVSATPKLRSAPIHRSTGQDPEDPHGVEVDYSLPPCQDQANSSFSGVDHLTNDVSSLDPSHCTHEAQQGCVTLDCCTPTLPLGRLHDMKLEKENAQKNDAIGTSSTLFIGSWNTNTASNSEEDEAAKRLAEKTLAELSGLVGPF